MDDFDVTILKPNKTRALIEGMAHKAAKKAPKPLRPAVARIITEAIRADPDALVAVKGRPAKKESKRVKRARANGKTIYRFERKSLDWSMGEYEDIARSVKTVRALSDGGGQTAHMASKQLRGLNHNMPFDKRASAFEGVIDSDRRQLVRTRRNETIYPPLDLIQGRHYFRRCETLEQVRQVGKLMENCLADVGGGASDYDKRFLDGTLEIWLAKLIQGHPGFVVSVTTDETPRISEAFGRDNRRLNKDELPVLCGLCDQIGADLFIGNFARETDPIFYD